VEKARVEPSSGNIFADMGLPNADEELAKAEVSLRIEELIRELGLSQEQAARRMGISQESVSRIVRGRLYGYSLNRLLRCLKALGQDVEILIRPASADREEGELSVVYQRAA